MLIAARTIFDSSVIGTDGAVGTVSDLYFSGDTWNVRYLVIETGTWLTDRKVLLAPAAIDQVDWPNGAVKVRQTRQQIKDSPPIKIDEPLSRQLEGNLARYFNWPKYWPPFLEPIAGAPPLGDKFEELGPAREESCSTATEESDASALRSAREVKDYRLEATDGEIGHVEDYIVDDTAWVVRYLVISTRNWLPGKKVLIAPRWAESIDWPGKQVHVGLPRSAIRNSPEFDPSTPVNRQYETHLYDFYGREKFWT
jgi:sporulation protein YlmC with PRC-barrel domain